MPTSTTTEAHRRDEVDLAHLEGLAHFHQLAWTLLEMLEKAAASAVAAGELFETEAFLNGDWRKQARITGGDDSFVDGLPVDIATDTDELVAFFTGFDPRGIQQAASTAHGLYVALENHLRDQRHYIERILDSAPIADELTGDDV